MNRKIFTDIKIKTNISVQKTAPVYTTKEPMVSSPVDSSHKYEFLEKKRNNPISFGRMTTTPQMPKGRKPFNKIILYAFILSLIVAVLYLVSTIFLRANITITPKNKVFELKQQVFSATKSKVKTVPFEIMIVENTEIKDVVLTSSTDASDKAKGEIILFNEYSNKAQKIVAGSFIADEKGKTYKTDTAVTIPAYTTENNKIIPGQTTVGITSFLAGEAYNGSPSNFYITSYKGTLKYNKIYGKLKTALNGGMIGLRYVLDDKGKETILSNVSSLEGDLYRKLSAQIPDGYILYPSAVKYAYQIDEKIVSKNPNTKIEIKGSLSAYLMKKSDLVNLLIDKLLPSITEKERAGIVLPVLSTLSFNFTNKDQSINKNVDSFDFDLTGNLSMDWMPNIEELKDLLLGKDKNLISGVFKNDPSILTAEVAIIPFWSKMLPTESKNIKITLKKID